MDGGFSLTTQPPTTKLSDDTELIMWEDYERYQAVKFYKSAPKDKVQHDPRLVVFCRKTRMVSPYFIGVLSGCG